MPPGLSGKTASPAWFPGRPGPRGAHKINDTVLKALAEARRDRPAITTTELVALVNRHFGVTVHRRTIERAFNSVKGKLQCSTGVSASIDLSSACVKALRHPVGAFETDPVSCLAATFRLTILDLHRRLRLN